MEEIKGEAANDFVSAQNHTNKVVKFLPSHKIKRTTTKAIIQTEQKKKCAE